MFILIQFQNREKDYTLSLFDEHKIDWLSIHACVRAHLQYYCQ